MFYCKSVVSYIVFFALLGGCAKLQVRNFFPPVGSEVILKQELSTGSGIRVFIQNGRVVERRLVNVSNPNCQFVLRRPRGETGNLIIQPDTFTITRTYRQVQRGAVNATMMTFMELSSESQPHVTVLECQRWGDPVLDSFVRIDEMKATLSPIVELNVDNE